MAGTRLTAHTCFLLCSFISVLVAWRLGVVSRAPLPLEKMANLSVAPPAAIPLDIDLILLRNAADGASNYRDCPSCSAMLDAVQLDPSLARDAFILAHEAGRGKEQQQQQRLRDASDNEPVEQEQDQPLFLFREVNIRVVHAISAEEPPPPPSEPEALDDWLFHVLLRQQYSSLSSTTHMSKAAPVRAGDNRLAPSSPPYTFFIGCSGGGDSRQLPVFMMGKHRHGYLGLGCGCACKDSNEENPNIAAVTGAKADSGDASSGTTDNIQPASTTAGESKTASPGETARETLDTAGRAAASAAALVVFQSLAGIVVAHILRSPVSLGDVHARLGQAYRLNFLLMSEDPATRQCTWDFGSASRKYLRPLLRKLGPVASFAVRSQEVHYGRLSPSPPRIESGKRRRYYYSPQDLAGFLGANDFSTLDLDAAWGPSTASSTKSNGGGGGDLHAFNQTVSSPHGQVAVNFMFFCPSPSHSPLVFMKEWVGADGAKEPAAEAYEVPGFGGVSVINPRGTDRAKDPEKKATTSKETTADSVADAVDPERIRRALGAHTSQLRRIIGLPRPADRPSQVPWPQIPLIEDQDGHGPTVTGEAGTSDKGSICGFCQVTQSPLPDNIPLTFLQSPQDGATEWEVDALVRAKLLRHRRAAADTLRSLAALVESSPEMEISSKIAEDVSTALAAIAMTDVAIFGETAVEGEVRGAVPSGMCCPEANTRQGGGTLPETNLKSCSWESLDHGRRRLYRDGAARRALRWAREALRRAEAAYFDPTMVPQLYFPQDHLMAVYMPFLGPLVFPLVWGFVQEVMRYRRKRRAKKEGQESESERKVEAVDGATGDVAEGPDETKR